MSESLAVVRAGPVARVVLSRPNVRNAFDAELIGLLKSAFDELAADTAIRVVVLSGEGPAFCGGADVNWMRASLDLDWAANVADASAMSRMFRAIDRCPKLVVARVQGAALGGGSGLVATCDVAIAASDARFGFTETTLGILPSVISPFVIAKIGSSHARALALTGERFDAQRALAIGLVHEVVAETELDAAVERIVRAALVASPTAVAATKALFPRVLAAGYDETLEITAAAIAEQRTSAEGQDGLRAFLEKRAPAWRS
jgi:methylglutaconyl-CoA hydratase